MSAPLLANGVLQAAPSSSASALPMLEQFISATPAFLNPSMHRIFNDSVVAEARRATRQCTNIFYTALTGDASGDGLGVPPSDSEGCAVAFVTPTSLSAPPDPKWQLIYIDPGATHTRLAARIPKLRPELFFGEKVVVWLDTKVILPPQLTLATMVRSTLTACGATFAVMANPLFPTSAFDDAAIALRLGRSSEEDAFREQVVEYGRDASFLAAENQNRSRVVDSPLLIRDLRAGGARHLAARALDSQWWSYFDRGGADRDQLPFAYSLHAAALRPCEASLAPAELAALESSGGADDVGCGVSCGQGFLNIMGHAATCPQNINTSITVRARYASTPPPWVCDMRWTRGWIVRSLRTSRVTLRAASDAADDEVKRDELLAL